MRRSSPSAQRNRDPILQVLRRHGPRDGLVLEIASGTGEHATYFAEHLGLDVVFQPSDPNLEARTSCAAWVAAANLPNLRMPVEIDVSTQDWWQVHAGSVPPLAAILCINMIHIAPWSAAEGLMRGAGHLLPPGGLLILYGPYRRNGMHTAPSNEAFDWDLRARNPDWGVRDLETVTELAEANGLSLQHIEPMPANNFTVIFRRR